MRQSENLKNEIYKKLEKDVTWEEVQRTMKPKIKKLQDSIKEKGYDAKTKSHIATELEKAHRIIWPETLQVLKACRDKWWLNRTPLLNCNNKAKQSIDWLLKNGFIVEVQCHTSRTRTDTRFYPLSEKGHDLLKTPQNKRFPTPRLFKHTFYQFKLGAWLREQGYDPQREYYPPELGGFFKTQHKGKLSQTPQRIDVFAEQEGRKVAYEITLHEKNLIMNVNKCFAKMGMDELHIVCETMADKESAEKKVKSSKDLETIFRHHEKHIHFRKISEFL